MRLCSQSLRFSSDAMTWTWRCRGMSDEGHDRACGSSGERMRSTRSVSFAQAARIRATLAAGRAANRPSGPTVVESTRDAAYPGPQQPNAGAEGIGASMVPCNHWPAVQEALGREGMQRSTHERKDKEFPEGEKKSPVLCGTGLRSATTYSPEAYAQYHLRRWFGMGRGGPHRYKSPKKVNTMTCR